MCEKESEKDNNRGKRRGYWLIAEKNNRWKRKVTVLNKVNHLRLKYLFCLIIRYFLTFCYLNISTRIFCNINPKFYHSYKGKHLSQGQCVNIWICPVSPVFGHWEHWQQVSLWGLKELSSSMIREKELNEIFHRKLHCPPLSWTMIMR